MFYSVFYNFNSGNMRNNANIPTSKSSKTNSSSGNSRMTMAQIAGWDISQGRWPNLGQVLKPL